MARRELAAAIVLLCLGTWYGVLTTQLPERTLPNTPGPSFFPWLITTALLVLSLALALRSLRVVRTGTAKEDVFALPRRETTMLVWFAIYAVVMPRIGFLATSIPFFAGLMVLYGERRVAVVASASVLLPTALYYLFRQVFHILLPAGGW